MLSVYLLSIPTHKPMQSQFWHDRWELNDIGFHQAEIHPLLTDYWRTLGIVQGQVFVPLCGKTLDMAWLRQQGHRVLGIELSPLAIRDFFTEQSLEYSTRPLEGFEIYEGAGIQLLCGDYFALKPEHLAQVEAVYDRAALIALPKDLQSRYAEHLLKILPQRPPILLISFEYDQAEMDGPPFSTSRQRIEDLFGEAYRIEPVSERDALEQNVGLKLKGLSRLTETAYRLIAL
jgi:thiopurine S-methyltransferase